MTISLESMILIKMNIDVRIIALFDVIPELGRFIVHWWNDYRSFI